MNKFKNNLTLFFASFLILGYAFVLTSLTIYEQGELKKSIEREFELKLQHDAAIIEYFLNVSKENIYAIANDKTINTFFANKSLGMSMRYGLHSSLLRIEQELVKFQTDRLIKDQKIYSYVSFIDVDGKIIASSNDKIKIVKEEDLLSISSSPKIFTVKREDKVFTVIKQSVFYKKKHVGSIIAEINIRDVISHLISQNSDQLLLLTQAGDIILQGESITDSKNSYSIKLEESPFILKGSYTLANKSKLITPWFPFAIALVALGMLISILYLLKINRNNIILGVKIATSQEQNQLLHAEIIKRQESERELSYLANYDTLTKLPNRLLFMDRLEQAIKEHQRIGKQFAVVFLDLDNFKTINDSLGHAMGDLVLQVVANRLLQLMRDSDNIARLGGDEFTVMLSNISDISAIRNVIEKLISSVSEAMIIDNHNLQTTVSVGVSIFPDDGDNVDVLLRNADTAMYGAKHNGRNTYQFYKTHMTLEIVEEVQLESQLKDALKNDEFIVYYQVQVDTKTYKIYAFEALVRWIHPQKGLIFPDKFIALAERTSLIIPLGIRVLELACEQAVVWNDKYQNDLYISVNISVKQLEDIHFIEDVKATLQKTDCRAEWISFEVTEGYFISNPEQAIKTLQTIYDMGIRISVDDFGTGYSSLVYLKRLPIDTLKIDKSFIDDVTIDADDRAIVITIISLARSMGLEVIAEGVETQEQQKFLNENGSYITQGYLFSKPLPSEEAELLIQKNDFTKIVV